MAVEYINLATMKTKKQTLNFKPQSYSNTLNRHKNTELRTNKLATMKMDENENGLTLNFQDKSWNQGPLDQPIDFPQSH